MNNFEVEVEVRGQENESIDKIRALLSDFNCSYDVVKSDEGDDGYTKIEVEIQTIYDEEDIESYLLKCDDVDSLSIK